MAFGAPLSGAHLLLVSSTLPTPPVSPLRGDRGNPSAAASSSLPRPLLLAAAAAHRRAKPGRRRRRRDLFSHDSLDLARADHGGCWRRAGGGARRRGLGGDVRAHTRGFP